MTHGEKVRRLKVALRDARIAKGKLFRAWKIAKHTIQDDLSPSERRRRLRSMAISKSKCLKAARVCAAIEVRILTLEME